VKRFICIIFMLAAIMSVLTGCGGGGNRQTEIEPTPEISSERVSSQNTSKPSFESDKYAVKAIEDDFAAEQAGYVVPQAEVDSDSAVSNAVIAKTKITVNAADKEYCDITVSYPDIEKEFMAALAAAGEDEAAADDALYALAQRIENDEIPLTEKNFTLEVIYKYYIYDVVRTAEFTDALMGGMYILEEGVL